MYAAASERILGNLVNVTNGSLSYVEPTPVVDGGRVHLSMLLLATPTGDSEGEVDTFLVCIYFRPVQFLKWQAWRCFMRCKKFAICGQNLTSSNEKI